MDGMLSQEEINALLSGMMPDGGNESKGEYNNELTDIEKDAIGEISNISMGTAATTLSTLVNKKVIITTPVVTYSNWSDIVNSYDKPCVFIQIYYKDGLDGSNILILKDNDVKIIADLMMGGDGSNTEGDLTEFHLSAISEAMNQMMGSSATSVSTMLKKPINITPPSSQVVDFNEGIEGGEIADFLQETFVQVSFNMRINNLVDSVLMQLYPFEFARELYSEFAGINQNKENSPVNNKPVNVPVKKVSEPNNKINNAVNNVNSGGIVDNSQEIKSARPYEMPQIQDINVQNAQFVPFTPTTIEKMHPENIDLLMDVSLEVVAELGRTTKSIKDILEFAPGTIIELNRLVGDPVDVVVSGKLVAKGEVVVIEEVFGIRITDIINK
ncbi:MAG TPA: flagellar motor switch phosphatase FliY [Clostridiales bacterium]|nr:flagellar motor switch phosphatase FliY [Clostridiales bacterium]